MTHAEQRQRRKAIAKAANGGLDVTALCVQFNVSPPTVRTACREYRQRLLRGPNPKRVYSNRHPFEVLARLKVDGAYDAQVARDCDLTREAVRQLRQRACELGLL